VILFLYCIGILATDFVDIMIFEKI